MKGEGVYNEQYILILSMIYYSWSSRIHILVHVCRAHCDHKLQFLTLGAHAHESYGNLSVSLSVCLLPIY